MLPETQFVIRVFPTPNKDWNNVKLDINQKLIHLRSIEDLKRGKFGSNIFWQFKTDGIFVNISQEDFYKATLTEDLLQRVMKGIDLVVLCFGSSGTGKTYSAFGLYNRYEYRGIAARLLEDLFKIKEGNSNFIKMDIILTYVEFIGKSIHNLLLKGKPVILKSGRKAYNVSLGVQLQGVCHGMKLLFGGDERRNYENENSHCGTSILTFEITCVSVVKNNPINTVAKIHIIDTAGTDYGSNARKSMKCHIDANLTKCHLNTLCSWLKTDTSPKNTLSHRGSVMAMYLGTSLTKGYVRLLGHIKTSNEDLPYSMSTLLFGTRLKKLQSPLLVQAKTRNADLIIKNLQDQIIEMKNNMVIQKLIKGTFMPETISQDQMEYIMREIKLFLQSETSESCLLAKAHPSILLIGLKEMYSRDMREVKDSYERLLEEKEAMILLEQENLQKSRKLSSVASHSINAKFPKKKTSSKSLSNEHSPTPTVEQRTDNKIDYPFSKLELESDKAGEENYAKTFEEFLTRYPQIKMKIKLYEAEIDENFKKKCELQPKLTELKYEINLLRIELLKEEWNTFNKSLEKDMCDRGGRIFKKSLEQEKLEENINTKVEKFNFFRSSLLDAHNMYLTAKMSLNETKLIAEKQYYEYTKFMYNNALLLPRKEKQVSCDKNEQTELKMEEVPKEEIVSRKCFQKLQRKPVKKKKVVTS